MAETPPQPASQRWGKVSLFMFCVLAGLFILDILLGKASVLFGWQPPFLLGDVGEYLVLLSTALFFTIATLILEHRENNAGEPPAEDLASGSQPNQDRGGRAP